MPLDKHIADFLAASSGAPQPASLAELRVATDVDLLRLQDEEETGGTIQHHVVIADDGYEIELRVYTPAASKAEIAQPAMLFAHGGGWCLGSLSLYDRPCQALANATGRKILSVDYRLAPEFPFPRPLEDVYQALCWENYLGDRRHPYAEPLRMASLRGVPPATILSCEYDPLRDEAEAYARRLEEAGVPVRCERLPGMVHACIHMSGLTPAARRLFERACI